MDLTMLEKLVQSPFLWSILCLVVVIFYYRHIQKSNAELQKKADAREKAITKLYEEHRKESNLREEKLMNHLEKTTETLDHIQQGVTQLKSTVDGGFQEVWEQIKTIKEGGAKDAN